MRQAAPTLMDANLVTRAFNRRDVMAAYYIDTMAGYWLIERTTAFFV